MSFTRPSQNLKKSVTASTKVTLPWPTFVFTADVDFGPESRNVCFGKPWKSFTLIISHVISLKIASVRAVEVFSHLAARSILAPSKVAQ